MHERDEMNAIRRRLNRLRTGLRLWQAGVGASLVLGVLAALVLLSLVVDRSARMDHAQRLLALLVGAVALGLVAWRGIVRPLRRRVSAEALLLRVERRRPDLTNRLVAAWEFASMPEPPPGASSELVAATIEQGMDTARGTDFRDVLDWPRFWRHARLGGVALAALLTLAVVAPRDMRVWFSRNVLLRDIEWPRRTQLQVQGLVDGVLRVPAGGDLELLVRAAGVQPDEVTFRYADNAGAAYGEQMPRVGEAYRAVFRGVAEPFRLQISGGDDRTGWIAVQLAPRPEIADVTVTIEPPAYTGLKRTVLDARGTTYAVPAGSRVVLGGRASLPLRELDVAIENNHLRTLSLSNAASFAVDLAPEQVKTATYRLQAVSAGGVASLRPTRVALRVEPDRPPRVTASLDGIGQWVLPRAVVPVVCELQDDYGVAAAWLEYQTQSPAGGNSGAVQEPIPLPDGPPTGGVVRVRHMLDLTSLSLGADATISLRVAARDGNTYSGPGQSQSDSFTLRVVTEAALREDFVRREQMLRQRMERLIQEISALADESKLFHAGTEDLKDQGEWRSLQAEKRQRQVAPALASVMEGLAHIRGEAYHNRLEPEPSPLRKRLDESALAPLREVVGSQLPDVEDRVAAARKLTGEAERRAAWREAESAQRLVVASLIRVRNSMLASADVGELMRAMEEIVNDQNKVNQETSRRAASAIEGVFEK